jgi:hypothetical protein
MKKLLWAGLLALPFLAIGSPSARADGCCLNLQGCFRLKFCAAGALKCWTEPFCCAPCGPCYAPGLGGGGGGGGCAGGNCMGCNGNVPGPWYTYWPSDGSGYMTSAYENPAWTYDMNFQVPAPVYPYWPAGGYAYSPPTTSPTLTPTTGFQPAGYYPSYWYGR